MESKLFCGVFKYSPNNTNPKTSLKKAETHNFYELELCKSSLEKLRGKGLVLCDPYNM